MSQDQAGQGEPRLIININGKIQSIYTTKQWAERYDIKTHTVAQMCDSGKLIATKAHGRWWVHKIQDEENAVDGLYL